MCKCQQNKSRYDRGKRHKLTSWPVREQNRVVPVRPLVVMDFTPRENEPQGILLRGKKHENGETRNFCFEKTKGSVALHAYRIKIAEDSQN